MIKTKYTALVFISFLFLVSTTTLYADQNDFRISLAHPSTPTTYGDAFPIETADLTGYTLYEEHKWEKHNLRLESFWISNRSDLTASDLRAVVIEVNQIPPEFLKIPNAIPVGSEAITIQLKLTPEGALIMNKITERNIGGRLAIILDNELIFCAMIHEPMTRAAVNLGGVWTQDEAKTIARRIQDKIIAKPTTAIEPDWE